MQDRFDRCLDGLLPESGAVLLAVSGGIDSMVMADLFLGSPSRREVAVAHCNFHLRGAESDGDEAFVREWAGARGIPFLKKDFDTEAYSAGNGVSIEMAARDLRYAWFASLCVERGFSAVAVAHNANDNAETLFLNLLRGTGLKGLCGMKPVSRLPGASTAVIVRPLLEFTREEIKGYALSSGLAWREDSSNADSAYKRNLIRNEVFPLLEKVNPSFLATLTADMRRFSQAQAIVDDFVTAASLACTAVETSPSGNLRFAPCPGKGLPDGDVSPAGVTIDARRLKGTPHWEYVLYRLLEPYGFNEAVVGDIATLIKGGGTFSGRMFHSKGYVAETTRDSIIVSAQPFDMAQGPVLQVGEPVEPQVPGCGAGCADHLPGQGAKRREAHPVTNPATSVKVENEGEYSLEGTRFVVDRIEVEDPRQPVGSTVAALDLPFTVRRWQAGDWMRPLGMGGRRKKLSDMFTDLKFTPRQKEEALVIADEGSHVLALVGWRVDQSVALPVARQAHQPGIRIRLI